MSLEIQNRTPYDPLFLLEQNVLKQLQKHYLHHLGPPVSDHTIKYDPLFLQIPFGSID